MINGVSIDVTSELQAKVRSLLEQPNTSFKARIATASVEFEGVSLLRWLANYPREARLYWSGRDYGMEVAAIGEADCQYSPAAADLKGLRSGLGSMLSGCEHGVRYYGGIRFDLCPPYELQWDSFGAWRFVLPRFEVRKDSKGTMLRCNVVLPDDRVRMNLILDQIEALRVPAQGFKQLPKPISHRFCPDGQKWESIVNWVLRAVQSSPLDKVVLARETTVDFPAPPEPITILHQLQSKSPSCFHFLFEPIPGMAFLGASPERLFRREGRSVESEAVAGTRPRGDSDSEDERMIDELFGSAKEQREHEFVRISLQEEIARLAAYVTMDVQPSIMRLASEIHLVSRLRAILRQEYTSLDVLEALHPSPAVGGYPSDLALEVIREREPFDRGWYAGPVGWIGVNEAEFAAGIRSGLVSGSIMRLYSGAGIVRGSTPSDEWDEIGHKISGLAKVLDLYASSVQADFQYA
ncbi:MAG: isochorismate synthase [Bacteroidota bacterium]|nr:isochorismate synthase [Bacteroidota bacterium]